MLLVLLYFPLIFFTFLCVFFIFFNFTPMPLPSSISFILCRSFSYLLNEQLVELTVNSGKG